MKYKVSDYIANFFVRENIQQVFSVVGGGAMYLNDSLGHNKKLNVIYNHHEQASSIAAESYARVSNKPAVVCVTSGPGGTNALTGCLCGYMGSIPMIFLSGQVRIPFTPEGINLSLRTIGEQEFDICKSVESMTKYSKMILDPNSIKYHLEKSLYLATNGRPGPVWLDIPLDIQNAIIDEKELYSFSLKEKKDLDFPKVNKTTIKKIIERLIKSERPVIITGMGIRLSDSLNEFLSLVDILKIPVVSGMSSLDILNHDSKYNSGRAGVTGDRAGNFAIQNSDFLLSIGNRLSLKHTGYDFDSWAREAYKVVVDIDQKELCRKYLKIDNPICTDAKHFILKIKEEILNSKYDYKKYSKWLNVCQKWVKKYPVIQKKHFVSKDNKCSTHAVFDYLSFLLNENDILVTTSGTSRVIGRQVFKIKKGQRFIVNHATSPMGYCLPALIGAHIANQGKSKTILVTGEGGFQMNIQELQTICHHKMDVKIIVINNSGYQSIRQTQKNFFSDNKHIGIGLDSGDLSFPELSKISSAYGFEYIKCSQYIDLEKSLIKLINSKSFTICEILVSTTYAIEPKASSKRGEDGLMRSSPLEDLAPFLPKDEVNQNLFIKPIKDR